jgi:hypothetical protein
MLCLAKSLLILRLFVERVSLLYLPASPAVTSDLEHGQNGHGNYDVLHALVPRHRSQTQQEKPKA